MSVSRPVPEGTVDVTTVQLHELLDVVRRRAIAGRNPIAPPSPDVRGWVEQNLTADPIAPDDVRRLANELIGKSGLSLGSDPEPAHMLHALRQRVSPFGLAFSGGGVRSASFCLGFLQAFATTPNGSHSDTSKAEPDGCTGSGGTPIESKDALASVDYLSSVSGGGYTGGMLAALAHRSRQEAKPKTKGHEQRQNVLARLTGRRDENDHQPFWTRLLHRGQAMGQLFPFLSRHIASTLVFNLALLGGLMFVACLLALIWRALDEPPLHTFIQWSSNNQALEYNRPLLIPLAVFTCYLIVALSRWDCSWGIRVVALAVPMMLCGAWMGLPYFIILSIVLTLFAMSLTLFSGALRKRFGGKQAQETNRVAWASILLFVLVGLKVVYLVVFGITVTGGYPHGDTKLVLSYPQLAAWTAGMVLLETGWVVYLSHTQFRQNHLRLDKVMLALTGLSFLAGAAVWVSTPNMNFGGPSLWRGSRDVMNVAVAVILALLVPFVRLDTVLRSGMKAQSSVQRRVFNLLSAALLLGVPFLLITTFAKHDISGYAGGLPRDFSPGDFDPELVVRRMKAVDSIQSLRARERNQAIQVGTALARINPALEPVFPVIDAWRDAQAQATISRLTRTPAYDVFLLGKLEKLAAAQGEAKLLKTETYIQPYPGRVIEPRWLTTFVEQSDVAIPVDPADTWDAQIRRFQNGARLSELVSQVVRDPQFVVEMLKNPTIVKELETAIEAAEKSTETVPFAAERKGNAKQLQKLLGVARARMADESFVKEVNDGAKAEANIKLRTTSRQVRENLETIGLLSFTTAYHDVPGTRAFGFVSRPVSIERDQLVRIVLCVLMFILFLAAVLTVDLNWASPLSFYRRQLREVYLTEPLAPEAAPRPIGSGRRNDPPLSAMDNAGIGLPYHLIGCSVDVVEARREPRRHLDYFLFSRRYCGAESLHGNNPGENGFRPTDQYCLRDETARDRRGPVRLADVMAISGAAVTPLRFDNWLLRVMLTVTNFRLGQWLPHPAQRMPIRSTLWNAVQDWPGWDDSMYGNRLVFVADGGFHDNLGIESLLERRCQTIVVVDAGADPNFTFAELTRVIQRASLRGIELSGADGRPLDLSVLLPRNRKTKEDGEDPPPTEAPGVTGYLGGLIGSGPSDVGSFTGRVSQAHFVTATIRYPEDRDRPSGNLVYVKPTFTGDEPTELLTFRKANPIFPHHSTVEQLFEWTMVDAYRRLGRHIGEKVIDVVAPSPSPTGADTKATEKTTTNPEAKMDIPTQEQNMPQAPTAGASPETTASTATNSDPAAFLKELDALLKSHHEQVIKGLGNKLKEDPLKEYVGTFVDAQLTRNVDADKDVEEIRKLIRKLADQIKATNAAVESLAETVRQKL